MEFDKTRRRWNDLSRTLAANTDDTDIFVPYGGRTAAVKELAGISEELPGMRKAARTAGSAVKSISDAEMVHILFTIHLVCVCTLYGYERSGGWCTRMNIRVGGARVCPGVCAL
jgi:hypothetical protein